MSDLPELPSSVPSFVTSLVHWMLQRQPSKRISANLAATICQLCLWAPRSWLDPDSPSNPDTQDILQVPIIQATKMVRRLMDETEYSHSKGCLLEFWAPRTK